MGSTTRVSRQGQDKFVDDCIGFLPTKTREQIFEHEDWYREFLAVSDKRRLALKRWREERDVSSFRRSRWRAVCLLCLAASERDDLARS